MMEPLPLSPSVRARMRRQAVHDTRPEILIRRALRDHGLGYRVHRRVVPGVRRSADIVFVGARVAVFVDGCFWHGCPEHYRRPGSNVGYWDAKVQRNVARDREVEALLADAGWTVLRAWEHEDPSAVADRVEAWVKSRRASTTNRRPDPDY